MADGADQKSQIYASPIFSMCESASDKLLILNYEEEFCEPKKIRRIPKVYFVLPNPKQNEQWRLFNMLCSWLCTVCTGDEEFFRLEEYDDPNTAANKLVLALKKLDFELDVPASKLKTPYGEAVASTLDFLTGRALAARGHVWGRPVYKEDELFDAGAGEGDEEEEVIEEDVDVVEEEDGEDVFGSIAKDQGEAGIALDESHQRILEAQVDPVAWKTELERVAPRLKLPPAVRCARGAAAAAGLPPGRVPYKRNSNPSPEHWGWKKHDWKEWACNSVFLCADVIDNNVLTDGRNASGSGGSSNFTAIAGLSIISCSCFQCNGSGDA